MKSVSFVPETIARGGPSRSPLDRLSVDWHSSKRGIFIIFVTLPIEFLQKKVYQFRIMARIGCQLIYFPCNVEKSVFNQKLKSNALFNL